MYEPEPVDWLRVAQILGALSPFLLLFVARVRAWISRGWHMLFGQNASHADLHAMKDDLSNKIADGFAKFHRETESIAEQLNTLLSGVVGVSARVGIIESMFRHNADRDEGIATIYCDNSGGITFASKALADWMDCDREELAGMRWLRFVEPDQRAFIREEIPTARDEHRPIRTELNMGPDGKNRKPYLFVMSPMPENPPLQEWSGYIRPVGRSPYITDRAQ